MKEATKGKLYFALHLVLLMLIGLTGAKLLYAATTMKGSEGGSFIIGTILGWILCKVFYRTINIRW